MGGFAYLARTAAGTDSLTPTSWSYGWHYPAERNSTPYPTTPISGGLINGLPWPDNWPIAVTANTVLNVDETPATTTASSNALDVESWLTVGGVESAASVYRHHLLQVTASEAGVALTLKKAAGDAYTTAIFYKVSNYLGNRWGFDTTIYFNNALWVVGDFIDVQVKLVTAVVNPSGTDQWEIVY